MTTNRFNIFALCFSFAVIMSIAVWGEPKQQTYEVFLKALAQKESGGDPNAWNEKENAAGLYQIRPCYVADVNRIVGYQRFTDSDRWNPKQSALMVVIYLDHYATPKRLDHKPTWYDKARIHNGGPDGWRRCSTIKYGKDVVRLMKEQSK
jgi:hypothetical protein